MLNIALASLRTRAHAHRTAACASHAARNTCTSPDTCAETALGILAHRALPLKLHTYEHSHAPYSLSDGIFIEQEQPKAAHNIFRLRGAKPALIPQPMWLMYQASCALVAHAGMDMGNRGWKFLH